MFFVLSKMLGFFAAPSNLFISNGLLGLVLLLTRFTRLASWLVVTSLVLLAIAGLSPLGNALILPLEERFPPWDPSRGAPDGIVVLGGAISPSVSEARDSVALDEAAERITATAELAKRESTVARETKAPEDSLHEFGFTVQTLSDELAERYGYEKEQGVIVSSVEPGSQADRASIVPGMLIKEVNREKVKNVREFGDAIKKAKKRGTALLLVKQEGYSVFVMLTFDE